MKAKKWRGQLPQLLFLVMLLLCVVLSAVFLIRGVGKSASSAMPARDILVIDPGHGGYDGGAVSDDGSKESDINLAIAQKLQYTAELLGQSAAMTRVDDAAKSDYASYSEHDELVRRTDFINEHPGALLVSIHQNDFPTSQPSGAQVYYAGTPGSERLGILCHGNLIRCLDPENRRVAAPAPKELYITSHVTCPAVLVECGFMSNNFEVQKLCSEPYQCAIAVVLAGSLLQYLNESEII